MALSGLALLLFASATFVYYTIWLIILVSINSYAQSNFVILFSSPSFRTTLSTCTVFFLLVNMQSRSRLSLG